MSRAKTLIIVLAVLATAALSLAAPLSAQTATAVETPQQIQQLPPLSAPDSGVVPPKLFPGDPIVPSNITTSAALMEHLPALLPDPEPPYASGTVTLTPSSPSDIELLARVASFTVGDSNGTTYGLVPLPRFHYLDQAGVAWEFTGEDWDSLTAALAEPVPEREGTPELSADIYSAALFPAADTVRDTVYGDEYYALYRPDYWGSCGSQTLRLFPPIFYWHSAAWYGNIPPAYTDPCVDSVKSCQLAILMEERSLTATNIDVQLCNTQTWSWEPWFEVNGKARRWYYMTLAARHVSASGTVCWAAGNWGPSDLCIEQSRIEIVYYKKKSSVTFQSTPTAEVYLGSYPGGEYVGTTVCTDTVPPGTHTWTIHVPDGCHYDTTVTLSGCGLTQTFNVQPRQHTATINFTSSPSGAAVWIDGQENDTLGVTPFSLYGVPLGNEIYVAGKAAYELKYLTVTPACGDTLLNRNFSLTPCTVDISGRVISKLGTNAGIPGVWVFANSPGYGLLDSALTNSQGDYVLSAVEVIYSPVEIYPLRGGDLFSPPADTLDLFCSQATITGVNFTDTTVMTISGTILYSSCNSAPAAGIEIHDDGLPTGVVTDSLGGYALPAYTGPHTIAPYKSGHMFTPQNYVIYNLIGDSSGRDFTDLTTATVSGFCETSCGTPIAGVTVSLSSFACTTEAAPTDEFGYYEVDVPPGTYEVCADAPGYIFGCVDSLTADVGGAQQDFVHKTPLRVVSDTPLPGCNALDRGEEYVLSLAVVDTFGCEVQGATLTIEDEVSDTTGSGAFDTSIVLDSASTCDYVVTGGYPRVEPKSLLIKVYKEGHDNYLNDSLLYTMVVTGRRYLGETFFTRLADQTPLMILYDPPGDMSYSYLESSETFLSEFGMTMETQTGEEYEVDGGVDAFGVNASITAGFGVSTTGSVGHRIEYAVTTSSTYETAHSQPDAEPFLKGPGQGTTFLAAGLRMIYGVAKEIYVDTLCQAHEHDVIGMDVDQDQSGITSYLVTAAQVKQNILPNPLLSELDSLRWANLLAMDLSADNRISEDEASRAVLSANHSWEGGPSQQHSTTTTEGSFSTFETVLEIDSSLATEFGLNIYGFSVDGMAQVRTRLTIGADTTFGHIKTNTIGYVLQDNESDDHFSTQVYQDLAFGVPAFITGAGTNTMCPWEPWTSKNEDVDLINTSGTWSATVCPEQSANFNLKLEFNGLLASGSEFQLSAPIELNSCGETVRFNGDPGPIGPIVVDGENDFLVALQITPMCVTCDYSSVTIRAQSICDPQIYSDETFTLHCDPDACGSNLWLAAPLANARVRDTFTVAASTVTTPLDGVQFYCRKLNEPDYVDLGFDSTAESSGGLYGYSCEWDTYAITSDTTYWVIAVAVVNGLPSDDIDSVRVLVDNTPPTVVSADPPEGGSYHDTIGVAFSEDVDASTCTCSSFLVWDNTAAEPIPGLQVEVADNTAVFIPIDPLPLAHQYTATVTQSIRDLAGNVMGADYSWSFVEGECCVVRGDLDGSGSLDVADLTYLVNYLFREGAAPGCPAHGDLDASEAINVADLTYLVNYLFVGGADPAACP